MMTQLIQSLKRYRLLGVVAAAAGVTAALFAGPAAAADPEPKAARVKPKDDGSELAVTTALGTQDVEIILAQAASQALPTQAIAVVDRDGTLLGLFGRNELVAGDADRKLFALTGEVVQRAIERARTAAYFQSRGEAFTTRTARFIIQNHFPQPIRNTPGGPLYGVEFANLPGSDVILKDRQGPFSGDPGGVPLYINNIPVGGIGVAGDLHDEAPVENFKGIFSQGAYGTIANEERVFTGQERADFDESVAIAGTAGYAAPTNIRATRIVVGGLRFPFTASKPARGKPKLTLAQLTATNEGRLFAAPSQGLATATIRAGEPERVNLIVSGIGGLLRITNNAGFVDPVTGLPDPTRPHTNAQDSDPVIDSNDTAPGGALLPDAQRLTKADVMQIFTDAVSTAKITRAGIRKPNGLAARVHVAVVDRDGTVLGVFRMEDGTNFSYDIAVQKARTAAYFSDDAHALSARGVGFMAQKFFPPGIDSSMRGPLWRFQDTLSFGFNFEQLLTGDSGRNMKNTPLHNGITIFPGGVPLYKGGVFVGGVGVSGDGVDQDDRIAFGGASTFQAPAEIRCDRLDAEDLTEFVIGKLRALETTPGVDLRNEKGEQPSDAARHSLLTGLKKFRLPFVKFPRDPNV